MPIVLGLVSSHAPSMFSPASAWPHIHKGLVRDVPQPARLADETPDVIADYVRRIEAAFAAIRLRLAQAKVDAVLLIGDDQTEVFSNACIPAIGIFTGEQASGTTSISWIGEKQEDNHVTIKNDPALAKFVLRELVARGFDPCNSEVIKPLGKPAAGIGHAFSRIARVIGLAEAEMPTIPIFINGYHPPQPTGRRCYEFGKALREIFEERRERIAIYGSGGMSHCPVGPRAGWVDEPLDRWVLEQIEAGRGEQLQNLFTFDSDTLRSGTGELRSWIAVAGAFHGKRGESLDYIPAIHAATGLGFAVWEQ